MNDDLIVLYEDNHIIVVLKEQNVPSCEDSSKDKDLLTIIKEYLKEKYNKPGNVFLGLVHRLDRPTGGVMVYAKTSKAAARLSEQMKTGDFEKKYLTVVVGRPREDNGTLVHYMKKNPVNNMVYICAQTTDGAKMASLDYKFIQEVKNYSLIEIKLNTGRSHQIRVQMNAIGTPVFGDMKYGGEKAQKGFLALWAYELSFSHPITKERLVFKVEPPKENTPWKAFNLDTIVNIVK